MTKIRELAACGLMLLGVEVAQASVIGFEGLGQRIASFKYLGVINDYQGYEWGYGLEGGIANRTFVDNDFGWGYMSIKDPSQFTPGAPGSYQIPGNLVGDSYAVNYAGVQSVWIDFKRASTVESIDAAWLAPNYWYNASSIQIFGYDANDRLVGQTAAVNLTKDFGTVAALMYGVRYLEIRGNIAQRWFGVDNLIVHTPPAAVPLPGAFWLLGSALAGLGWLNKRKQA